MKKSVAIGIAAFATALVVWWAVTSAQTMHRVHQLKGTYIATLNFYESNGRLPQNTTTNSGVEIASWRYELAPFLDSPALAYQEATERWDEDPKLRNWRDYSQTSLCKPGNTNSQIFAIRNEASLLFAGSVTLQDADPSTILFVHAPSFEAHWMEPLDIEMDQLEGSLRQAIGADPPLLACRVDGSIWEVSPDAPVSLLSSSSNDPLWRRFAQRVGE